MDPVLSAISFAARKHKTQMRKDRETPYVAHPVRVMLSIIREFGEPDPDTLVAAILHDTIEDTSTDADEVGELFGDAVAGYVSLLTKDKRLREEEREDRFFEQLAGAPRPVRLCKIADTLDNLRDAKVGAGNVEKTIGKARRLFDIYGNDTDATVKRALELLRREM